jgi:hypothetical protein
MFAWWQPPSPNPLPKRGEGFESELMTAGAVRPR